MSKIVLYAIGAFLASVYHLHAFALPEALASLNACIAKKTDAINSDDRFCKAVGSKLLQQDHGLEEDGIKSSYDCTARNFAIQAAIAECKRSTGMTEVSTSVGAKDDKKAVDTKEENAGPLYENKPSIVAPKSQIDVMRAKQIAAKTNTQTAAKRVASAAPIYDQSDDVPAPVLRKTVTSAPAAKKIVKPAAVVEDTSDDDEPVKATPAKAKSTPKAAVKPVAEDTSEDEPAAKPTSKAQAKSTPDSNQNSNQNSNSNANSYSGGTGSLDADLASCARTMSKAKQCCGSPASCLTGSDRAQYNSVMNSASSEDDGLTDACTRMQQASTASGDINGKIGAVCTNNQYACQNTCAAMATKYQQQLSSCGESCDDYSTLQDAISTFNSNQSTCYALEAKGDAMLMQSASSQHNQDMAAYCQSHGGSSGAGGAGQPGGMDNAATSAAPSRAGGGGGYQGANASSATTSGGGRYGQGNASTAYASLPEPEITYATGNYGPGPGAGSSANVKPILNGGGGGLPGSGGVGGGANASGYGRPSPGSPGFSTDVDQGFRAGGYSAPGGGGPTDAQARGAGADRAPSSSGSGSGFEGVDLKDYLPGGSKYRAVAGAGDRRSEINAKEEDIFRRISLKYLEKCKLGLLYQCKDDR